MMGSSLPTFPAIARVQRRFAARGGKAASADADVEPPLDPPAMSTTIRARLTGLAMALAADLALVERDLAATHEDIAQAHGRICVDVDGLVAAWCRTRPPRGPCEEANAVPDDPSTTGSTNVVNTRPSPTHRRRHRQRQRHGPGQGGQRRQRPHVRVVLRPRGKAPSPGPSAPVAAIKTTTTRSSTDTTIKTATTPRAARLARRALAATLLQGWIRRALLYDHRRGRYRLGPDQLRVAHALRRRAILARHWRRWRRHVLTRRRLARRLQRTLARCITSNTQSRWRDEAVARAADVRADDGAFAMARVYADRRLLGRCFLGWLEVMMTDASADT